MFVFSADFTHTSSRLELQVLKLTVPDHGLILDQQRLNAMNRKRNRRVWRTLYPPHTVPTQKYPQNLRSFLQSKFAVAKFNDDEVTGTVCRAANSFGVSTPFRIYYFTVTTVTTRPHSLTHSLIHYPFTYSLAHSLIHSFTHSLTHALTFPLANVPTRKRSQIGENPTFRHQETKLCHFDEATVSL
jgi:hypothetical protein